MNSKICVAVTNYDFSDNADRLHAEFSRYLPTVLIDASSPTPPNSPHVTVPNTYYPGLWNAAVAHALDGGFEWLMFVASDLEIDDVAGLCRHAMAAAADERIGIYTPSLAPGSRCSYPGLMNRTLASMRDCKVHEGFFFLSRLSILKPHYPIPAEWTRGWLLDVECSYEASLQDKLVVVDDRVMIHHPMAKAEHAIDPRQANEEALRFVRSGAGPLFHAAQSGDVPVASILPTSSLDLGCGPHPANSFDATEVFGVDIRNSADGQIRSADLNVEPIPFASDSFDYVTAHDFIEHVARLLYVPQRRFPFVELMNEIHRVLKPGGVFLSVTPAYPDPKAFQDPTHVNVITELTFSHYFCVPHLWAEMYGFSGRFAFLRQEWNDGKLVTFIRAVKG